MTNRTDLPTKSPDVKSPALGSNPKLPDTRSTTPEELKAMAAKEVEIALGALEGPAVPDPLNVQVVKGNIDPTQEIPPVAGRVDASRPASLKEPAFDPNKSIAPEASIEWMTVDPNKMSSVEAKVVNPRLDISKPAEIPNLAIDPNKQISIEAKVVNPSFDASKAQQVVGPIDALAPAEVLQKGIDPNKPISVEATLPPRNVEAFLDDLDTLFAKPTNHSPEIFVMDPMSAREARSGESTLKRYTYMVEMAGFTSIETYEKALKAAGLNQQVNSLRAFVHSQQSPSLSNASIPQ